MLQFASSPPLSFTNTNTFIALPVSAPLLVRKNKNVVRRSFVPPAAVSLGSLFLSVCRAANYIFRGTRQAFCRKYFFWRVAFVVPSAQRDVVDTSFVGPLGQRQILSVEDYALIAPSVVSLLFTSSPAAVFRRVVAIVIISLQGIALRARPHISQKLAKASPLLTNFDPSPTVALISGGLWRHAAASHHGPCNVLRGAAWWGVFHHTATVPLTQEISK